MRDATPGLSQQSTGRFEQPSRTHFERDLTAERLAAMVGGAALVVFAARDRSWRAVGAAAAGVPLIYRGATGTWPVPRAVASRAALTPLHVETSVIIDKPAQELYDFWRRLENLPKFMRHLEEVHETGDRRSHWVGHTPFGARAEWEAEIVEERSGRLISWRSVEGSQVDTAGSVLFEEATGGRGTVVRVEMDVRPPGHLLGKAVASFSHNALEREVKEDLRRFKNLMEAGEVPTTEGQPHGQRSMINPKNRF